MKPCLIHDRVFADGVDQHGNLIVKIGPDHSLAKLNAVDRSRLISGALRLLEAAKELSAHLRPILITLDAAVEEAERGDQE